MRPVTLALALVLGCGSGPSEARQDPATQTTTPPTSTAPSTGEVNLPRYHDASPTTLRVINASAQPIRLVVSFGDGQPFEIHPADGEPRFVLGSGGDLVSGPSCDCRCGRGCLQCEPPQLREVSLANGERFEFEWSGRVRVASQDDDGGCFEPYGAPAGAHRFTACLDDLGVDDRECVSVDAELPTEVIEFRFQ